MRIENELILSSIFFGLVVSLFTLLFGIYFEIEVPSNDFICLIIISTFFSYWLGRLYERKIKEVEDEKK